MTSLNSKLEIVNFIAESKFFEKFLNIVLFSLFKDFIAPLLLEDIFDDVTANNYVIRMMTSSFI